MSRHKTKPVEIRNPEHYFNRYIALEILHDLNDNAEYYKRFDSLEEILSDNGKQISREKQMLLATNENNELFDKHISESSFLGWIEMIENRILYSAIKRLSVEEQILLTYQYKMCLSQRQIAEILQIPKSTIDYQERKIRKKIKKFFEKFGQNL